MSFTGILAGTCAILTGTSSFDDTNTSFMDMGILDTSTCRWGAVFSPGPLSTVQRTYGSGNVHGINWGLIISMWLKYEGNAASWQGDTKTLIQDTVDAVKSDPTLSDSCEHSEIELIDIDPITVKGRRYNRLIWSLTPQEWD